MDGFQISVEQLYDMDPNRIESITILKDRGYGFVWFQGCQRCGGDYDGGSSDG